MTSRPNSSRKIRNFILKPDIQLAFAINIIALSMFFALGVGFVVYYQLGDFIQNILAQSDFDGQRLALFQKDWDMTTLWLIVFIAAYVMTTVVMCVIYTHKMLGPSIAFKRHIQSLISQNYLSRVNLRDGDAFEDVAESLNELAATLQKSRSPSNSSSAGTDPEGQIEDSRQSHKAS